MEDGAGSSLRYTVAHFFTGHGIGFFSYCTVQCCKAPCLHLWERRCCRGRCPCESPRPCRTCICVPEMEEDSLKVRDTCMHAAALVYVNGPLGKARAVNSHRVWLAFTGGSMLVFTGVYRPSLNWTQHSASHKIYKNRNVPMNFFL